MSIFLTFVIFSLCFAAMAVGLIFAKKVLTKGCSVDPDACKCKVEGKDPSQCNEPK